MTEKTEHEATAKPETAKKKNWFERHKVLSVLGALFVMWCIVSAASHSGDSNSPATTPTASTTPAPQAAPAPAPQPEQPKPWDVEAIYAKLQNGMTKAQVEETTGRKSDNCTESQDNYLGKSEICSYGNAFIDKGTIMVTFINDKVSSKTKSTY